MSDAGSPYPACPGSFIQGKWAQEKSSLNPRKKVWGGSNMTSLWGLPLPPPCVHVLAALGWSWGLCHGGSAELPGQSLGSVQLLLLVTASQDHRR